MLAIAPQRLVLFVTAVLILAALTHHAFYVDRLDPIELDALNLRLFESEQEVAPNGMLSFFKSWFAPDLTSCGISDTYKRANNNVRPSHSWL